MQSMRSGLLFLACAVAASATPLGREGVIRMACPSVGNVSALRNFAKEMFDFGYSNYMEHAFPLDELDPIHCAGRGVDRDHPDNININDVLGNYSLGLVDSLDTIALMGDRKKFVRAVESVISTVSFDQDSVVQVFEVTIRALGGLLSAHLIASTDAYGMKIEDYDGELLMLARDLGNRLLPAFEESPTGIPYPRVNLRYGVPRGGRSDTCTAGAGSLILEFGLLSKLTGDPVFESVSRRATFAIWERRDKSTGLLGSTLDVNTGKWIDQSAALGAGVDSFFEYLFKAYIVFGDKRYYKIFEEGINAIGAKMWGRHPPVFYNVNMHNGMIANFWIDSLQAFVSGMLCQAGMLDAAIAHHAMYYGIWLKYGALPERFNLQMQAPEVKFYPLRPELAESTYYLYQATGDVFYLDVGRQIMCDLEKHTKVVCGYGTVHDVTTKELEDRMESYFLSETLKYLYLLFDDGNIFDRSGIPYIFTTQGHIIPLLYEFQKPSDEEILVNEESRGQSNTKNVSCRSLHSAFKLQHPVSGIHTIMDSVGLDFGIRSEAGLAPAPPTPQPKTPRTGCFEQGIDYFGNDIKTVTNVTSPFICQENCKRFQQCLHFTLQTSTQNCYLKNGTINRVVNIGTVSGPQSCVQVSKTDSSQADIKNQTKIPANPTESTVSTVDD